MRLLVVTTYLAAAVLLLTWVSCVLQPACRAALPEHDAADPPIGWPAR